MGESSAALLGNARWVRLLRGAYAVRRGRWAARGVRRHAPLLAHHAAVRASCEVFAMFANPTLRERASRFTGAGEKAPP